MQPTPYRREPGYAERYRDTRFRSAHGPRTDRRERAAIRDLLLRVRSPLPAGHWLDMPSGTGRMTMELPGPAVQVDRNPAMLTAGAAAGHPQACGCATALPFADGAFVGALCCRLLQHLPTRDERIAVLRELARVCRGPIVVSFFDAHSLLHVRRLLRRATGKNRSGRSAISRRQFRAEVDAAGLRLVGVRSLSRFLAEQTFALLLPIATAGNP